MAKSDVEEGKACAALSYILIGIIWYLVDEKMKKNEFAKFHVKQGLVLLITSIIINVVGSIVPILGWFIILPLGSLLVLVLWILGIINSLSGNMKELPLIGQFAKKFTF
jgi:uncharacterized membrane protein